MDHYHSNLIWVDLEMTGLDPAEDTILEIATIITNNELDIIAHGPELVIHHDDTTLSIMDDWNRTHHTRSGLIKAVQESRTTLEEAEEQTLSFIKSHTQKGASPLCGNSVWQDRIFLRKYMPSIVDFLHYRIVDVSSIKEVAKRWYPTNPYINFVKAENHRALEDIEQSIEELKHYKTYFFTSRSTT